MAREILIIINKFKLPDGDIVIGLNTGREELRDEWVDMSMPDLKLQFEGKKITVIGENYQFKTSVLDVDILNSLAEFKNVFLKLKDNSNTRKIEIHDEVEIDL